MSSADSIAIVPLSHPPQATVQVPGSKSITNRALVLAALASRDCGCTLHNALRSEDTAVMFEALRLLGFDAQAWPDSPPWLYVGNKDSTKRIPASAADLFVG